jgi:hypothetical protein
MDLLIKIETFILLSGLIKFLVFLLLFSVYVSRIMYA